jgi:hypothetical protein
MKAASKAGQRNSTDVYSAFRRLSSERRRDVALRILKDEKVLADLYDHLLIKQAAEEVGASVEWVDYRGDRA